MNQHQSKSAFPYKRQRFFLTLHPPLAWIAILSLFFLTSGGILLGLGKLITLLFPAGALAVGLLLYFRYPIFYVGFVWWIWFLTPLIRRLADYTTSFTESSPILLAPYLVTSITLVTLWRNLPTAHLQSALPFVLAFTGVFYGLLVGLTQALPPISIGISLLDWGVPVLLGFHLFINWRHYPSYRHTIQRTFLWGVLMMGLYGVFQYMTAPEWDTFWMIKSGFSTAGKPEPFMFRVWSTLEAPGPFANVMKSGLLAIFSIEGLLFFPAFTSGLLSLLLSLVRSAWGGFAVGALVYLNSLRAKHQMRLLAVIIILTMMIMPLIAMESFSENINSRFDSLTNIEGDSSAKARAYFFQLQINEALTSFIGKGIGDKHYDWGIFTLLFNLGWIGTIFYMGGMILLISNLFRGLENRSDTFFFASRAVVLSNIIQLPFGSVTGGIMGLVLWGFLGIGTASLKYYRYSEQLTGEPPSELSSTI